MLKYGSSSKPGKASQGEEDAKTRKRNDKIHSGAMTPAGWSDAAYGDQSSLDKCRLGYVRGLMSSTTSGPCHSIQWTSNFARKLVKSSLGGEVYAFSEMPGHLSMLRESYGHSLDFFPGTIGFEDCGSLVTHLKNTKMIADKFLVRRILAILQASEGSRDLGLGLSSYWAMRTGSRDWEILRAA